MLCRIKDVRTTSVRFQELGTCVLQLGSMCLRNTSEKPDSERKLKNYQETENLFQRRDDLFSVNLYFSSLRPFRLCVLEM